MPEDQDVLEEYEPAPPRLKVGCWYQDTKDISPVPDQYLVLEHPAMPFRFFGFLANHLYREQDLPGSINNFVLIYDPFTKYWHRDSKEIEDAG